MKNVTKYFGFVAVALEWATLAVLVTVKTPDLNEPFSQYGIGSTRLIFGTALTVIAILIFLFMRHLDVYWKHSSTCGLIAGILLAATGWVPYRPHTNAFVPDVHNLSVLFGLVLYLVPVFFIAYRQTHRRIAYFSKVAAYLLLTCSFVSIGLRVSGGNVLYIQIVSIVIFQIWVIVTNFLLLEHHKEITAGHHGKL